MPVVRISDPVYERLQQLATPFVDTPDTVIQRLLDSYEDAKPPTSTVLEFPVDTQVEGLEFPVDTQVEGSIPTGGRGHPRGEFLMQGGHPARSLEGRATENTSSNGATRGVLTLKSGIKLAKSAAFRWLGFHGYSSEACLNLAQRCGWSVTKNNLLAQHGDGCRQAKGDKQTHGPVPNLSPTDVEELQALLKE